MKDSVRNPGKLAPDQKLGRSLPIILRSQVKELFSYEETILATLSPDAVHDMRVSARRVRALLRLFRPAFPRVELKVHLRTVSSLIQSLGRVRDCDVMIDHLESSRKVLATDEQIVIDTLIADRRTARTRRARKMAGDIGRLHAANFENKLLRFVESSFRNRWDERSR